MPDAKRKRISDTDGNGVINAPTEIIEENNYYPFGLKHKGYNNVINGTDHPYGFNGKEEQNEFNGTLQWLDFGARNYDASLGRWMNVDPKAENSRRWTPYNYAYNNPIYFIDPDGMQADDWFKNQEGRIVWHDNTSESFTSENGDQWENVGENLEEVEENIGVPEDKNVVWEDTEFVTLGGSAGNGRGVLAPVRLESSAQISFDLNVENAGDSGLELIDGKTEVTGVNINVTVSTQTAAPVKLTGLGGSFGIEKWTPLGKTNGNSSNSFQHTPMLANYSSHVSGKASLTLGLQNLNRLTKNFGEGGSFNIGINSSATFKLQHTGRKGFFNTSNTIKINK